MGNQCLTGGSLLAAVRHHAAVAPGRPALVRGDDEVTYGELIERIDAGAAGWGLDTRSVVGLVAVNHPEFVIAYLGALQAGHVPLLLNPSSHESLVQQWRPAAVATVAGSELSIERSGSVAPPLHPDLALLLSTSGSTGSPKLVRLSERAVAANAGSIAEYLSLTPDDRAITTLPLHYCYGLSVLHSHLAAGASVVLSDASVVDPCFHRALRRHEVTNFAGVPHTFELLERSPFDPHDAPALRFVTQAGGRLAPDLVTRWARRLGASGIELFVMYGQTEATARMAYLPPDAALEHPGSIGRPIPGGRLELRPHDACDEPGTGELVYRGDNVMMGYARNADDLARGQELAELRTGDLARQLPGGLYEIVGRAARFVKPFGLRIDLDHLEARLRERHPIGAVVGDDRRLVVAAPRCGEELRDDVVALSGLPVSAVHLVDCADPPRTPNGKIDGPALMALAPAPAEVDAADLSSVAALYAAVLGREHVARDDTFIGLGGDSLNYVECSIRLESLLGAVPDGWHLMTVGDLEHRRGARPARFPRLDTTVLLRAFSIAAVVSTHMRLQRFPGGAHLLLTVAGYNFARFQLGIATRGERVRSGLRTAVRVGGPASAWIAANMLLVGGYSVGAVLLVNNYTGSAWRRDGRWQYWFFEVFVQLLVVVSLALAVPAVRRLERRTPFGFATGFTAACLVFRFGWVELGGDYNSLFRTHTVAWFFGIGWMIATSRHRWHRVLVSAVALASVPHFFGRGQRETFIVMGMLLLIWLPSLPMPRWLHRPIAELATASMWIFLVHWQVWPLLDAPLKREVAYVLTLAVGIAVARAVRLARPLLLRARDTLARRWRALPAADLRRPITTRLRTDRRPEPARQS